MLYSDVLMKAYAKQPSNILCVCFLFTHFVACSFVYIKGQKSTKFVSSIMRLLCHVLMNTRCYNLYSSIKRSKTIKSIIIFILV